MRCASTCACSTSATGRRGRRRRPDDPETALAHADAALAAYRGDLLPGAYDDWVLEARAECQERAVELCALVCATRTRLGTPAAALDAARLRIRLRPLEEAGYRELMRLQAALGDRAAALGTYHRCASVLERELGVEPDEATRVVAAAAARRSRDADPHRGPSSRSARALPRSSAGSVSSSVLRAAWQRAAAGRPGVVARPGRRRGREEPARHRAHRGRAPGGRRDGHRAVLRHLGRARPGACRRVAPQPRGAGRPWPGWTRCGAPRCTGWCRPRPTAAGPPSGSRALVDAWQRHRFYEGLARALLGVGRPTLLVLDDVQWCDPETLTFLGFCLGLVPDAPLLLAATLRSDGAADEPEPAGWIARMRAAGLLTDLPLGPLDGAETARLAEAVRGAPLPAAERALLVGVTGGFPLHVVEAMRAVGPGSLPAGDLDAVLRSRLGQASPAAQGVAALAAAVGRDVTLDLLVAAGELDADGVVAAVDELWRLRILREQGPGYDFSHDLLRDAAYAGISPARRWLLHRRVAQGLEELHADDTGPVAAQLAEQYARGGRPERPSPITAGPPRSPRACSRTPRRCALYDAALEIVRARPPGRDRDADELAILEAMAAPLNARRGYADVELQAVLERSVALAEALGRRESLVDALVGLWTSLFVQGRIAACDEVARRALALADGAPRWPGPRTSPAPGRQRSSAGPAEAVDQFATAAALAPGMLVSVGTRTDVHGQAWAAHAHWLRGDDAAAAGRRAGGHRARPVAGPPLQPRRGAELRRYHLAAVRRPGRAAPHGRRAARAVRALRLRLLPRVGAGARRLVPRRRRRRRAGRQGVGNLAADGAFARQPYWLALLADLLDGAGARDEARSTLDAAAADARARDDVWWLPEVLRMRAAYDGRDAAVSRLREAADAGRGPRQRRPAAPLRARPGGVGVAVRRSPEPGERANAARTPPA